MQSEQRGFEVQAGGPEGNKADEALSAIERAVEKTAAPT